MSNEYPELFTTKLQVQEAPEWPISLLCGLPMWVESNWVSRIRAPNDPTNCSPSVFVRDALGEGNAKISYTSNTHWCTQKCMQHGVSLQHWIRVILLLQPLAVCIYLSNVQQSWVGGGKQLDRKSCSLGERLEALRTTEQICITLKNELVQMMCCSILPSAECWKGFGFI